MKWVINAYNGDIDWIIKDYSKDIDVYDKKITNTGYNIDDYMDYIVKHYDDLPDVVLFGKSNMLERHITKEEFDKVVRNTTFTPLLTQNHKTDGVINYYKDGIYYERNDSWYFNHFEHKYNSYKEIADALGLPNPSYLGFAPGGCYIVPKANILKHPKEFYQKIKDMVSYTQLPAEAHAIERALYTIWL